MINWNDIRAQFPACNTYTYLNPAGGSPISIASANAAKQYYDEILMHGDILWEDWMQKKESARAEVAKLINAETEEIGFITNTSQGMNYIADILLHEGAVITMDDEFPSTTIPWLQRKIPLTFVPSIDNCYPIEHIEKYITPATRILVSSYVQYKTGFRQDLDALSNLCKKHSLIYVVNATQAIGAMPIDVKQSNIDMLVFTGLKWALAGYGASVLFISKKIQNTFQYPFAGWLSVDNAGKMDNKNDSMLKNASAVELGCSAFPNIFALGKAMELFNSLGSEAIYNRIMYLNEYLRKQTSHVGLHIISPNELVNRSGITIILSDNAAKIVEQLHQQKIIVSTRGTGIRASVHIYNNESDIDIFVNALSKLI